MTAQEGLRFPLAGLAEQEGRELPQAAVLVSLCPLQAEEARRVLGTYPGVAPGLLCCCPGLDPEAGELFRSAANNGVQVILCATSFGRWRDCFEDAANATGASLIAPDEGVPIELTPARFGRADGVRVEAGQLVIVEPAGIPWRNEPWVEHLRRLIQESSGEEKEWHCRRLGQFTGGVITVEICGQSTQDTDQLDGLASGALHAGVKVIGYGYVPGGGVAYLRGARDCLGNSASQVLRWALEEPTRTLLAGTRLNILDVLESLRADEASGLDVVRNELPRWRTEGPIDPTSVVQTVIECAVGSAIRAAALGTV